MDPVHAEAIAVRKREIQECRGDDPAQHHLLW